MPAIAAAGGMVVPALLYLLVTAGSGGARGWGIPMATDIAFAIGVVALLGPKVPSSLKLFLLTLAMVDDIGAMVVIAVFYADDLQPVFLLASGVVIGGILIIRRFGVCCRPAWLWVAACGLPPEPRACRPPLPGSVSPSPLFITELAFDPGARQDAAKIGVLTASTLAAALGATVLRQACRSATTGAS